MSFDQKAPYDPQPMTEQPAAQASMTPAAQDPFADQGNARNVQVVAPVVHTKHTWSNPLFSCFGDVKTCCVACWCPCITFAGNKSRLQYLETSNIPHPHHGESMSGDCFAYGCLQVTFGLGWVLAFANRADIRTRYRIESTALNDLLTHWCCTPCALTQESREIELEEKFIRTNPGAPMVV